MAPPVEVMQPAGVPEPYYSAGLRARFELDGVLKPNHIKAVEALSEPTADISYETNEARYNARVERRLRAGGLATSVPPGFPTELGGPLVWKGVDFNGDETSFEYLLTKDDKAEVTEALRFFKEQELDGDEVSKVTFPLPNLSTRLQKACEDVYNGKGFVIIRGLDPDEFTDEDFTVVYLGVTSYIAERRGKQDQRGSMLMHVMRRGADKAYDKDYSSEKPFHTDTVCDALCLITKSCSAEGGQSVLASSWSVYNELAATRPDLIHTLAKPDWPFDTYGRDPPYYRRALLYYHEGKAVLNLSRRLLVGHPPSDPRSPGIPGLNEAQAEALDAVHFIARKMELHTSLHKGDIRIINNMAILHRREKFEDHGTDIRHLVRLWLNNEEMCWRLPAPMRLAWARVYEDNDRAEHWDIFPLRKDGKLLRVAGSCD